VVGLVVSAVFLYLALRRIDVQVVWSTLANSHWWPWYVLAPSVYLVGLLMRGLRCREILKPHCDLPVATSTNIVVIGYAANNVLPARLGEVARAYVLSRKANLTVSLSLAVTFLERIFDGLTITLLLLAAAMYSPLPAWGREVLFAAGGIFAIAVTGVVLVMVAKSAVLSLAKRMTSFLPEPISERILSILDRAIAATDCLRDPLLTAKVAVLSLLVWLIEGAVYMLILPAFDLPLNPIWALMAMCVTNLGILVPSSPGYVGPFQYFCMMALGIFGVPRETGLGFAVMAFFLTYVPVTTWGLAAIAYYRIDLGTATHGGDDDGSLASGDGESDSPLLPRAAANR
jgi:glycosyltransferase 2 family protein